MLNCFLFQSRHIGDFSEPGGHEGSSDLNIWGNLWTVSLLTATSRCYDTNIISLRSLNRSHTEKNDLQFYMLGNKGFLLYLICRNLFLSFKYLNN